MKNDNFFYDKMDEKTFTKLAELFKKIINNYYSKNISEIKCWLDKNTDKNFCPSCFLLKLEVMGYYNKKEENKIIEYDDLPF